MEIWRNFRFLSAHVFKSPLGRVVWSVQVEAIVVSLFNQRLLKGYSHISRNIFTFTWVVAAQPSEITVEAGQAGEWMISRQMRENTLVRECFPPRPQFYHKWLQTYHFKFSKTYAARSEVPLAHQICSRNWISEGEPSKPRRKRDLWNS